MLKARKAEGKCVECWQYFRKDAVEVGADVDHPRARIKWQGKEYHKGCWEGRYKGRKLAQTKLAKGKRSF